MSMSKLPGAGGVASSDMLDQLLVDTEFEGLWASCTAKPARGDAPSRDLVRLTERLVEASLL